MHNPINLVIFTSQDTSEFQGDISISFKIYTTHIY